MYRLVGIAALLLLLVPMRALAQTVTVNTLGWEIGNALPAEVATYTTTITVNGTVLAVPPVCVVKPSAPTDTACSVTLPTTVPPTGNTISIVNAKNGSTATLTLTNVSTGAVIKTATNPRVIVTTTTTVALP